MGYFEAIEANEVKVKSFKEFGSYQGTWIAILEDGRYVEGSYGSCSGCDAFQSEFDYDDEPQLHEGKYYKDNNYWSEEYLLPIEQYEIDLKAYEQKLKDFGSSYLLSAETKEEIIARYEIKCNDKYAWEDDKEILEWLKTN